MSEYSKKGLFMTRIFGVKDNKGPVQINRRYNFIRRGLRSVAWQFTARAFLRAILQHVDYEYNVDMYQDPVEPEYKRLFTQLLYSYKLNARTVLFVGYSDNSYADHTYDLTRSDYTLFVKIGYAFVL